MQDVIVGRKGQVITYQDFQQAVGSRKFVEEPGRDRIFITYTSV